MLINQNFSIPAGDDGVVALDVLPEDAIILAHTTIFWMAYEQQYGCPTPDVAAVIYKTNQGGSTGITLPGSPADRMYINFEKDDTIALLRNYYHEACYYDQNNKKVTVTEGIMTVLGTENRPSGF